MIEIFSSFLFETERWRLGGTTRQLTTFQAAKLATFLKTFIETQRKFSLYTLITQLIANLLTDFFKTFTLANMGKYNVNKA